MNGTVVNWLGVSMHLAHIAAGRRNRRGVSLMEVLISIFVLSIGLMGVAALIPVGRFSIVETGKADRSAACGRAALREIKIRKMLERTRPATDNPAEDVHMWLRPGNPGFDPDDIQYAAVIDPLGVAEGFGPNFPYCTSLVATIPRLTLRKSIGLTVAGEFEDQPPPPPYVRRSVSERAICFDVAYRIFRWQDDLLFEVKEDDADQRPLQLFRHADGSVNVLPANAMTREFEGNYSWMVMVTPSADPGLCSVSVVVFYKRNFEMTLTASAETPKPSERVAVATFPAGGGFGGGDMELALPGSILLSNEGRSEYLDIKENTWLMLCNGTRFIWYRVVAVADELSASGSGTRLVTLAGPDWDLGISPNDARAVLCDEVVGVYTQTVELDTAEAWSR